MISGDLRDLIRAEFEATELGHGSRRKRACAIAAAMARRPDASLPQMFADPDGVKRTSEFLNNPLVEAAAVRSGHTVATVARVRVRRRVLAVQDLTELDYTSHGATRGLGPIGDGRGRGLLVHTTLLVDPTDGAPLGVIDQQVWARPDDRPPRAAAAESSRARKGRADRESRVWVRAVRATAAALADTDVEPVLVADQGGDIFENLEACRDVGHGFVVRAYQNRALATAPDAPPTYLQDAADAQPIVGYKVVAVPARPGRAARTAHLALRTMRVVVQPPRNRGRTGAPQTVGVVLAQEVGAPAGVEPLRWCLLTSEPVETVADALRVVGWYERRWLVEEFHAGLKTGCAIEARQFKSRHAIENFLAFASVVAWALLGLRALARQDPPAPAAAVLTAAQQVTLRALRPELPAAPSAREALRAIAALGGFLGRKGDGEPGWRTLWRGMQELLRVTHGLEALLDAAATPEALTAWLQQFREG